MHSSFGDADTQVIPPRQGAALLCWVFHWVSGKLELGCLERQSVSSSECHPGTPYNNTVLSPEK